MGLRKKLDVGIRISGSARKFFIFEIKFHKEKRQAVIVVMKCTKILLAPNLSLSKTYRYFGRNSNDFIIIKN